MRQLSLFFFALILSALTLPAARADETYNLKYTITWGPLVVFETSVELAVTPDRYRIATKGKTKGLAALFYGGKSAISSEGLRTADGPLPQLYQNQGKFGGNSFQRVVFFDDTGRMLTNAADWPEEWTRKYPRQEVPVDLRVGPDPVSNLVRLVDPSEGLADLLASGEEAVFRSYDGRTVFDYKVQCKIEPEILKKASKSFFFGEARACYTDFELIAGELIETEELKREREKQRKKAEKRAKKRPNDLEDDKDAVNPDDERFKIWLGEIENAPSLVPVRAAVKTPAGTFRVYLREFERIDGTPRMYTETLDKEFCKTAGQGLPARYC